LKHREGGTGRYGAIGAAEDVREVVALAPDFHNGFFLPFVCYRILIRT
jgi:hypothetical protein